MARVLHSHFDYEGDDPRPTGGIPMETRSRRWQLVETVSVLSESHIVSSGFTSWCRPVRGRGPSEERCEMMASSLT